MNIIITKGKGSGHTELSAFDNALYDAGIGNFNLIRLTSIIPPGSKVVVRKINWNQVDFGNKLYVVLAKATQVITGKEAWAGIGWVQSKDGQGMFIEHTAESQEDVVRLIKNSLNDIVKYRPEKYGQPKYLTCGITCKDRPVCAVVAAVYQSEGWSEH